ncbi:MAG: hypothetical protein PHY23_00405 [Oscillospiraceae bacterium]|nr:hypothetical protein [Oscillospiraceae bacterium]
MRKLHRKLRVFFTALSVRTLSIKSTLRHARKEAARLGVTLHVDESDFIDNKHLDCFWYGGPIGAIEYDGWTVSIDVNGDVSLYGEIGGKEIEYRNNENSGAWGKDICSIIKSDRMLCRERQKISITYGVNSWVDCNLIAPDGMVAADSIFYDGVLSTNSVLDNNVLSAFVDLQYYVDLIDRYKTLFTLQEHKNTMGGDPYAVTGAI